MRPIKVLQLISNPTIGGTETVLSAMGGLYPPEHVDLQIANFYPQSAASEWWKRSGVKYSVFDQRPPSLSSMRVLYKLIRREKPDVVDMYGFRMTMTGRLVSKLAGVPVVTTGVRSIDDWRKWYHVLSDRYSSWMVDMYISNSRAGSAVCGEREHIPAHKRKVIYTGVDLSQQEINESKEAIRKEIGIENPNTFVFLHVAMFRQVKAHDVLIRAVAEVKDQLPNAVFVFCGEGELREPSMKLARDLGVEHMTKFLGLRLDVPRLLHAADAFVLVSHYEGLPRSICEAMSAGLPVVGTQVAGIPELVRDGETGFLVMPGDTSGVGQALVKLATDPARAREMGQRGRTIAQAEYDINRAVEETWHTWRDLLIAKKGKAFLRG